MSLYSDWKFGCITDAEFRAAARREYGDDRRACFDDDREYYDESEDFFDDDELDEF